MREYSRLQEFIDNLPYMIMVLLGAAIFLVGFGTSFWGWVAAGFCIVYGVVGTFWVIMFVCPYCHYYDTKFCPCGYGKISAKLRPKKDDKLFMKKFKKNIPVIVPLWIAPIVAGGISLILNFSTWMLALTILFVINSFIVLPLVSTRYGCAHCPQRNACPWMRHKGNEPHI